MSSIEQELRELEETLLHAEVRRTPEVVAPLLAEEFREFGSSGRIHNKAEIVATLQREAPVELSLSDFAAVPLSPEIVLVTYRATRRNGEHISHSLRSSIWIMRERRWQILFHQGTRTGE